jgi:hypothetical protein
MRDLHAAGKLSGAAKAFMAERRPAEELYDLQKDPFETVNLANKAEYAAVLERMRRSLSDWIRETRDAGEVPEPDIPAAEKLRSKVQGWLTNSASLTQKSSGLIAEFRPAPPARLSRTIVQPAGEYVLEFRARSKTVQPKSLITRLIEDMRIPAAQQTPIEFTRDGEWHTVSVPFRIKGWLGAVSLLLDGHGPIEWEFIRLKSNQRTVEEWQFRAASTTV